ncbi:hypothetical protein WBJ53_29615 [Spirosoma sp. SC4-14]
MRTDREHVVNERSALLKTTASNRESVMKLLPYWQASGVSFPARLA